MLVECKPKGIAEDYLEVYVDDDGLDYDAKQYR